MFWLCEWIFNIAVLLGKFCVVFRLGISVQYTQFVQGKAHISLKLSDDIRRLHKKAFKFLKSIFIVGGGKHMVAQLFETLRYKSEGHGFDSRWCH